jgi:hypothetical protein
MYINLKTAKALGITIPLPLSGRADELFECWLADDRSWHALPKARTAQSNTPCGHMFEAYHLKS